MMTLTRLVAQHLGWIKAALLSVLFALHLYAALYSPLLWSILIHPPIQFSIWILVYLIIGSEISPQDSTKEEHKTEPRDKWLWGVRILYVVGVILVYSIGLFIIRSWEPLLLSLPIEMGIWGIGVLLFCVDPEAVRSIRGPRIRGPRYWSPRTYVLAIHQELRRSFNPVQTFTSAITQLRRKGVPSETINQILRSFAIEDTDVGRTARELLTANCSS